MERGLAVFLERARKRARAGDVAGAERLLVAGLKRHPQAAALLLDLGHLRWRGGNLDRADLVFRKVARLYPGNVHARTALLAIAAERAFDRGDLTEALQMMRGAVDGAPPIILRAALLFARRMRQTLGWTPEVLALFQDLAAAAPKGSALAHEAAIAGAVGGEGGTVDALRERLDADSTLRILQQAWTWPALLHLPDAAGLLASATPPGDDRSARRLRLLERLVDRHRPDVERAAFVDDLRRQGYAILERPGASATILYFAGLAGLGATLVTETILRDLDANAILLWDRDQFLGLRGIDGLAPSFEGTVDALKAAIARLGASRVVTYGTSAGGYSAIRYALALGADHVLAGAAPTSLRDEHMAEDARAKAVVERGRRHAPERMEDLRALLMARRPPLKLTLFYGAYRQDEWHAERLAGIPGIALAWVREHVGHDVDLAMAADGRLRAMLEALLRGDTPEAIAAIAMTQPSVAAA